MAKLDKCKTCDQIVSRNAKTCPHCGEKHPVPEKLSFIGLWFGTLFWGGIAIWLFGIWIDTNGKKSEPVKQDVSVNDNASKKTTFNPKQAIPEWYYSHNQDQMGKGIIHYASLSSVNTVNFNFPYSGDQHASLSLMSRPRKGKAIIFDIEKGQIVCHTDDCYILIRFNDEDPITFSASGTSSNKSNMIFINNYEKFFNRLIKAKRIRIAPTIFQEGNPVFEFDVSGFDQSKFLPKTIK